MVGVKLNFTPAISISLKTQQYSLPELIFISLVSFIIFEIILVIYNFSYLLSFSFLLVLLYNLHKGKGLICLIQHSIPYAKNNIWQRTDIQYISVE